MPEAHLPRRPDSMNYQNEFQDHIVTCRDCDTFWRFGCEECADHHVEYHVGAFPGHDVVVKHHHRMENWPPPTPRRRQRNSSTRALFGRRNL